MLEVRTCAPDEVRAALDPIWHYFGGHARNEDVERFAPILPPERVHAAFDDGAVVGGAGAYLFETTVPGGAAVPTAGVMAVGVLPTHRRHGALTELMRRQLADAHERDEPLATLFASEGPIYGRFGYGLASLAGTIDLPKEHALLRDAAGETPARARLLADEEEALEVLPAIYDRVRAGTVGMYTRSADWWRVRRFHQRPGSRGEQMRVVLELDGAPEAYALYRLDFGAQRMITETKLRVAEALGTSPRAHEAIWRYLLSVDWVARIEADWLPLDHPLLLWVREPRRLDFSLVEALWVRLVDVGAGLAARTFREGEVVLEIHDSFCPWNEGRWRIAEAAVERTSADPDLRLGVAELGSVYLGGFTFDRLRRAGRLEEATDGAVARADELFRSEREPWTPELF